jgi:hypothetical protein
MLIAWVTPDAAHILTVASWVGSTTLARLSTVNTAGAYPTSAPALSSAPSDLYPAFRTADSHKHLGYSEACIPTCFAPIDTGTAVSPAIGADAQGATYAWFNPTGTSWWTAGSSCATSTRTPPRNGGG